MRQAYFQRGRIRAYLGDTLEVMAELEAAGERFDLVFTSPPYNLGVSAGGGLRHAGRTVRWTGQYKPSKHRRSREAGLAQGYRDYGDDRPMADYVAWQQACLRAMWRLLTADGAIFFNHKPRSWHLRTVLPTTYLPSELLAYHRQEVILRRFGGVNTNTAYYLPTHERIEILARPRWRLADGGWNATDVWDMPVARGNAHPAPFDPALPGRAIATTGARSLLDPFCGSGSSLVAADQAGIAAVGIDRVAEYPYLDYARERLEYGPLFGGQAHLPLAGAGDGTP